MKIVLVSISVKKDFVVPFIQATIENAKNSVLEPGIVRFDVIQSEDDETRFILVEVYRSVDAQAAHKETEHYKIWRDTVVDMMSEPREGKKYKNIFPNDEGW